MSQPFANTVYVIALMVTLLFSSGSWASPICKLNGTTVSYQSAATLNLSNTSNSAATQLSLNAPSLFCLLGANPYASANGYITSGHATNGYGEVATSIPGVAIQFSLGSSNWRNQLPYTLNSTVNGLNSQNIGAIFISVINRTPGSLANYTGPKSVVTTISFEETRQKQPHAVNVWTTVRGTVYITVNVNTDNDGGTGGSGNGGGGNGGGGNSGGIQSCALTLSPNSALNFGDLRLDQLDGSSVKRPVMLTVICSNAYPATTIPVRIVSTYGGTQTQLKSNKKEVGIVMTDEFNKVTGHGAVFNLLKGSGKTIKFSPILNDGPLGSVEGVFTAGVVFQIVVP